MSDVLFKISCVTCSARLSVRNEAVIGQILACPKCGSMVQVTPPAPSESTTQMANDAEAAAKIAASDVSQAEVVPPDFSIEALEAQPTTASDETSTANDDAAALEKPAIEPQASSYSLIAWATAGVVALAAGVGVLLYATSGDDKGQLAIAPTSPTIAEDSAAPPTEEESEVDPPLEDSTVAPELPTSNEEDTLAIQSEATSPELGNKDSSSDVPPVVPSPPTPSPAEPPSDSVEPTTDFASEEPTSKPKRTLLIDPLDLDPEGLDLSTFASASAPEAVSVPSEEPQAEVEQALELPDQPPELPRVQLDQSQQLPQIDTNEVLATRIPSFEMKAIPLCEFLDFLTRMSALPVSAEPEQLRLAGVSSTKAVSVSLSDTTVEGILTKALEPLRLTPVVANDQVVLGRVGLDNLRKIDYPVDDLLDSSTTAKSLGKLVSDFVAPESWNTDSEAPFLGNTVDPDTPLINVEGDTLIVTQQERRHYEILRLLETLRVARGMKPRSKYPEELLQATSPYVQLSQRLNSPATFTFSRFTPAEEVFRHWQNELGLAVLVDWPSLAKLDLRPQSRLRCSATEQSWSQALDEVLTPLGLAWRAVDGRTLQITTIDETNERTELAFYPLQESRQDRLVSVEQFVNRLSVENGSPTGTRVFHDRGANALLVLNSPAIQRKLAAWLIEQDWSK